MKAKINVELYNEDKSNYAPVFPIDLEDKRACRGTRRRRFATWQPLMGYGSSPAFTFRASIQAAASINIWDTALSGAFPPTPWVSFSRKAPCASRTFRKSFASLKRTIISRSTSRAGNDSTSNAGRRIRSRISSAPRRMSGVPNISSGRFPPTRSYLTLCHPMGQRNRAPSAVCRRKSVPRSCCSTGNILRRAGKSWGQRWRTGISSCGSTCSTRG